MVANRFPVESGHVQLFARSIGESAEAYSDPRAAGANGLDGVFAPPTFVQASAQFDPDFPFRPRPNRPWMGSGAHPTGLSGRPASRQASANSQHDGPQPTAGPRKSGGSPLHAEQHFAFERPVRVGDVLAATQRPGRTWEKQSSKGGKLVFSESITEYRDASGDLVVTATAVAVQSTPPPPPHDEAEEA